MMICSLPLEEGSVVMPVEIVNVPDLVNDYLVAQLEWVLEERGI